MSNIGKESEVIEFKEGIAQLDKGVKALSAMLNRHHHGTVFFGVSDSGDIIGMDVGDSTLEKIRNAVRTDIVPRVIPEISVLESDDGRMYVSVEATGHSVPYSWKEKYYIRNVTSNESASPDILSQKVLTRGMDPLKDLRSDVQDLSFDHLFALLNGHGFHPRDDLNYYRSAGMLDDKDRFNLTAYLLSDQNSIPMQVVEFAGTDRSVISRRTDFGGCSLLKSMDSIAGYVMGYMETYVDTGSVERTEKSLFDADAFREAWVNACVHNAWRTFSPPSVLIFDDRMEIISYGRIPFPLSSEEFFSGDSRPLNPSLFAVFAKLNRIEQSGHGVPRIVKSYGREAFHITDSGLKVTIPFAFVPRFVLYRDSEKQAYLGRNETAVLSFLKANPAAKLKDVSESTGISLSSVKKTVTELKSKGLLKNEGSNRNSRWTVQPGGDRL
ncbi:MAG: putative DNA binding domain-containing protein [Candidatus Methanomethylophilaceae archaeon]|nr:putative DNA binding domain-containing protein [Candidatus Methanomethylophilaceae archaeon]